MPDGRCTSTCHRSQQTTVRSWLGGTLGWRVAEIVTSGDRIVQETIGVDLLNTIDPARLLRL
jgi:hypothetical protein